MIMIYLQPMWDEGTALLPVEVRDASHLQMSIRSHSVHHSQLLVFPLTVHLFNPHLINICAVPCAHLEALLVKLHKDRHRNA